MNNIASNIEWHEERPAIFKIHHTDKINFFAVGLLKSQLLKKHSTKVPTLLTVLKGSIEFYINDDKLILNQFDTYQIPVTIEHEVLGLEEENIFTLMQER